MNPSVVGKALRLLRTRTSRVRPLKPISVPPTGARTGLNTICCRGAQSSPRFFVLAVVCLPVDLLEAAAVGRFSLPRDPNDVEATSGRALLEARTPMASPAS